MAEKSQYPWQLPILPLEQSPLQLLRNLRLLFHNTLLQKLGTYSSQGKCQCCDESTRAGSQHHRRGNAYKRVEDEGNTEFLPSQEPVIDTMAEPECARATKQDLQEVLRYMSGSECNPRLQPPQRSSNIVRAETYFVFVQTSSSGFSIVLSTL
jgi:hypothetical protein